MILICKKYSFKIIIEEILYKFYGSHLSQAWTLSIKFIRISTSIPLKKIILQINIIFYIIGKSYRLSYYIKPRCYIQNIFAKNGKNFQKSIAFFKIIYYNLKCKIIPFIPQGFSIKIQKILQIKKRRIKLWKKKLQY